MARLPNPGGDDGTWGDILNDYLSQEHNSDGTLKIKSDGTLAAKYEKPSGGIPSSDLTSAVQTSLTKADNAIPTTQKAAANGVASLGSGGKVPDSQLTTPIQILTQAEYNALSVLDSSKLYVVID